MRTIHVPTASPYDVLMDDELFSRCGALTCRVLPPCHAVLVADERVLPMYGDAVQQSFEAAGFEVYPCPVPAGEAAKTPAVLLGVLSFMAQKGLTRSDIVIALGGGSTGDVAGLAAALYMRGIRYVQLPTTLLAAVDAAVGGKTAVDLPEGKNLIGAFHQPALVMIDTTVLSNLPAALLRDGAAEIIKYGVLFDRALFEQMATGDYICDLEDIVARCVAYKRDVVAADERDGGMRQLLNLGHTFGHAIEVCSGYQYSHGQSVGLGLLIAAGAADVAYSEIKSALESCGLPTRLPGYTAKELTRAALLDKKRQGDTVTLVLPKEIGACELQKVRLDELEGYFERGMRRGLNP